MRCIRPVLIGLFAFAQHMALAQPTFSIYNGSTESCQGVMHDTGGPAAFGYQNNEDITFTLCPDQPGAGMQFNFVVSTNEGAVRLWQRLGFEVVGRLPAAFDHPAQGFVDALVMFKALDG